MQPANLKIIFLTALPHTLNHKAFKCILIVNNKNYNGRSNQL